MRDVSDRVPPSQYPWWVKFCTWVGKSRRAQWTYLWLSVASAAICVALLVLLDLRASTFVLLSLGAVGFAVSVVWYGLCIRWIDRNGTWGLEP